MHIYKRLHPILMGVKGDRRVTNICYLRFPCYRVAAATVALAFLEPAARQVVAQQRSIRLRHHVDFQLLFHVLQNLRRTEPRYHVARYRTAEVILEDAYHIGCPAD